MSNAKILCAAIAALSAASLQTSAKGKKSFDGSFRVGTYNIRCSSGDKGTQNAWKERREDFCAFVEKMNLDVIGLQEVCPDQLEYLKERFPGYSFAGCARGKDRKSGEYSPVMYRKSRFAAEEAETFWLSETPDAPGSRSWKSACPRICTSVLLVDKKTGKRFRFANTHTDHVSLPAKANGTRLILDRLCPDESSLPLILTGDFNSGEREEPAKIITARLDNAMYASATPPAGSWRTDNNWRIREPEVPATEAMAMPEVERNVVILHPNGRFDDDGALANPFFKRCGGRRIDFIYVPRNTRVLDYKTHNDMRPGKKLYPSDHFPVTATVILP